MSKKWKGFFNQLGLQVFLLGVVTTSVLFPVMWVISLALDPRNIDKPLDLRLIPPGASLDAFRRVLFEPFGLLCRNPGDPSTCMTFGLLLRNSLLVALGTDGTDGPTDAAGAVATGETIARGRALGLDPVAYLANNDSYHYFDLLNDLIRTGPTGTNVNDLLFIFVFPQPEKVGA